MGKIKEFFQDEEKVENLKNTMDDVLCGMAAFGAGILAGGFGLFCFGASGITKAPAIVVKIAGVCADVASTALGLGAYKKVIEPTIEEEVDNTVNAIQAIVNDEPVKIVCRYSEAKKYNEEANI